MCAGGDRSRRTGLRVDDGRRSGGRCTAVSAEVGTAREGVCHHVGFSLDVYDGEVEEGERLEPARLAAGEHGLSLEVNERLVIGEHAELRADEVVTPGGETGDDGELLLLVNGVARLGLAHLLREERNGLEALALVLLQDAPDGKARGIGVHDIGELGVG